MARWGYKIGHDRVRCESWELKQGQGVVFRGDVTHRGAAYEAFNLRIHVFLNTTKSKHTKSRHDLVQTGLMKGQRLRWPDA